MPGHYIDICAMFQQGLKENQKHTVLPCVFSKSPGLKLPAMVKT